MGSGKDKKKINWKIAFMALLDCECPYDKKSHGQCKKILPGSSCCGSDFTENCWIKWWHENNATD